MLLTSGRLLIVTVVASVAVAVLTAFVHQASSVATADRRIRSSLRTRVHLLTFARLSDL
jgi:hypothetical protein